MSIKDGEGPRANRDRLNVYLRRRGTLQALKLIALLQSEQEGKKVRVNDLVNDALEAYIRDRIDLQMGDASNPDPDKAWRLLDFVDVRKMKQIPLEGSDADDLGGGGTEE